MKVAFLDRDGTINVNHTDTGWAGITSPELLDGTLEGMRYLQQQGYEIIIITNQYPIGEGAVTQEYYDDFMVQLHAMLNEGGVFVKDVFFCPHRRDEGCSCIKPKPGMILKALEKYPEIDMSRSFFCGDSEADRGIAEACSLPFYGIHLDCENRISSLRDLIGRV